MTQNSLFDLLNRHNSTTTVSSIKESVDIGDQSQHVRQ